MDPEAQVAELLARHALPGGYRATLDVAVRPLARRIVSERRRLGRPVVVGLCGSQGSGKTTFAAVLDVLLQGEGLGVAVLSVDDLYLTAGERRELARTHHPLLATRGPPGTHDVALGLSVLEALTQPGEATLAVALPRFDKAADTRADLAAWTTVAAPVDVVLFEGWFVGARSQPDAALTQPVNALERVEDADGVWRRTVNDALAGEYQALFARIDLLVLLQAPGFEQVYAWRALQEARLAERLASEGRRGTVMDAAALQRFIQHYERLTRWILEEMPARADVVVKLDVHQEVTAVRGL